MIDTEKIKEIFEQYKDIVIFASKNNGQAIMAANSLLLSLKKFNKNATVLPVEDIPPHSSNYASPEQAKADFLISIKEGGAKLSQLFYEKTNNGLNLFLKTDGQEIKQGDIALKPLRPSRLLIAVGLDSKEQFSLLPRKESDLIFCLSNQKNNGCAGNVNIVEPNKDLSEIVFEIIKVLSGPYFVQEIEREAQTKFIANSERYVFEIALSNLQYRRNNGLLSTTISHSDLVKNSAGPKDIKLSLAKLTSGIFTFQNFLLLWEQNSSHLKVHGILYSPNSQTNIEKLSLVFNGHQKCQAVIFKTLESNLVKAKEKIFDLLNN